MELDRSAVARIDRKLLAGLGQDETYRMVRVPITASEWSTWKRYCESASVSMGRALLGSLQAAVFVGVALAILIHIGREAHRVTVKQAVVEDGKPVVERDVIRSSARSRS